MIRKNGDIFKKDLHQSIIDRNNLRAIYDVNYAYVTELFIIKNAHYNENEEDPVFLNFVIPILFQKVYSHLYIKHKNTTNLQITGYIKIIYQKICI